MGSRVGVEKVAAGRIGVSVEEYRAKITDGLKFCYRCRAWKFRVQFGVDQTRGDGLASRCDDCRRVSVRRQHIGGPVDQATATRAIEAVRAAVRQGRMAPIRSLPCLDCGKPARHYHHHLGYERSHWLDVVPLCFGCHKRRHIAPA